jgi:Reverse transcriptase (RNA-dependent DNA polymerase)
VEVLRAPDDVRNAHASTAAYLAEQHPNLSEDPRTIREAMRGPDAEQWATVYDKELDMLFYKGTFVPVTRNDLSPGTPLLGSVTVLRTKFDEYGNIAKRKARINLNGKQQQPGVHFDQDDLYSPVGEKDTLRTVLAAAAANDLHIEHWDIESALLHGTLPEGIDIYMRQPPRANGSTTHPECVVKIGGNYYGARQGPKIFSDDLSKHLVLRVSSQCRRLLHVHHQVSQREKHSHSRCHRRRLCRRMCRRRLYEPLPAALGWQVHAEEFMPGSARARMEN